MTDDTGTTVVQEEFCGKLQLVVAAPNYQTERKVLDACSTKFMFYDAGCEAGVRVDLLRVGEAWRLRGIQ